MTWPVWPVSYLVFTVPRKDRTLSKVFVTSNKREMGVCGALIIRQSQRAHEEIVDLLQQLQRVQSMYE